MVAFSTVKAGDVLYDCRRQKMGNTTMGRMATWTVRVLSVDPDKRTALCSWNGNRENTWHEWQLKSLRRSKPNSTRTT